MSVFIYTELHERKFKKNAFELASYAREIADKIGTELVAIAINPENPTELGEYGVDKVIDVKINKFCPVAIANLFEEMADGPIIFSHTIEGLNIAPIVAVKLKSSLVSNILGEVDEQNPFVVKRKVFSGKGIATVEVKGKNPVLTLGVNNYKIKQQPREVQVEVVEISAVDTGINKLGFEKNNTKIDLKEAELVVSGGRGLKSPENWNMIEELAEKLGAATACSKPVSDMGWRPHSEHVGQTGKSISPNLYIAVAMSGAIQHLAGVNSSKTIVVINNDPEAPFFKAADYGIVGDAFEVVPKMIEALKKIK